MGENEGNPPNCDPPTSKTILSLYERSCMKKVPLLALLVLLVREADCQLRQHDRRPKRNTQVHSMTTTTDDQSTTTNIARMQMLGTIFKNGIVGNRERTGSELMSSVCGRQHVNVNSKACFRTKTAFMLETSVLDRDKTGVSVLRSRQAKPSFIRRPKNRACPCA
jgi:hypothetical protein